MNCRKVNTTFCHHVPCNRAVNTTRDKKKTFTRCAYRHTTGTFCLIAPYISDCIQKLEGFRRLHPFPLPLADLKVDLLLTTHDHLDHFDPEGIPLIRYRTKDLTSIDRSTCQCGRTSARISRFKGRVDDMLIIRGVNVFPSQIETVLLNEGYQPNYQIVVDRETPCALD